MTISCFTAFSAIILPLTIGCNSDDGGASDDPPVESCPAGSEGCACDGNGTCNGTLSCLSDLCVEDTSPPEGSAGSTERNDDGMRVPGEEDAQAPPSSTEPAEGGSGGTPSPSMTGPSQGGKSSSAGGTSGEGGAGGNQGDGGSSGEPACEADLMTDENNCGRCGRVCRAANGNGETCSPSCCVDGRCPASLVGCASKESGAKTCADVCMAIGEQCVAQGCRGDRTLVGWGAELEQRCMDFFQVEAGNGQSCDDFIDWSSAELNIVRCCCTDTQP